MDPEQGRRQLWAAFLIFRWGSIAWMIVLAVSSQPPLDRPLVAAAAIAVTIGWNAWFTVSPSRERLEALLADLAVTAGLVLLSGVVVEPGQLGREAPSIATFYKWSAPMVWGASRGIGPGVAAGAILSAASVVTRPLNGVPLHELRPGEIQDIATTVVIFLAIGAAVGAVSRMQQRSAMQLRAAMDEALRERERSGRLRERERLVRQIHDSALQVLALIHKRGRELARRDPIPAAELLDLADMARAQEETLRSMILRRHDERHSGSASLRTALEALARTVQAIPVSVSSVGPVWLPTPVVDEVIAAVRQAIANVVAHATASKASIFAEEEDGMAVVAVRDDGRGFTYDEEALRDGEKLGILRSIKGRIEELSGTVLVETSPGRGTEIELRVPSGLTPAAGGTAGGPSPGSTER